MTTLFLLLLPLVIGVAVYIYSSKKFSQAKKQRKINWKPLSMTLAVVIILYGFMAFGAYKSAVAPDTQCTTIHNINPVPPLVATPNGYFKQGDFYYDQGNCIQAIAEYTRAIQLNPLFAQAYNNRAYTNMRLQNYKDALPDLDKAIQINPNYVNALMNRGDIHNFYYATNRQSAIADYQKVIALGGTQTTSVCGHFILARNNGWHLSTFVDLFTHLIPTIHC